VKHTLLLLVCVLQLPVTKAVLRKANEKTAATSDPHPVFNLLDLLSAMTANSVLALVMGISRILVKPVRFHEDET
jgi:hypothetical protein